MTRSFLLVAALAALSLHNSVDAWTTTSSSSSSFAGRALTTPTVATSKCVPQNGSTMSMKKGKANVPPQMRGQYKKQQEMKQMQDQMIAATKAGDDGLPVFNLFVRTKRQNVGLFLFARKKNMTDGKKCVCVCVCVCFARCIL